MQSPGQKPPVGVLFDGDFGVGIDDALALALLYGLEGKGECRVAALSVSYPNLNAAVFCEVFGRFLGSGFFRLPFGLRTTTTAAPDTPMLRAVLDRRNPDGTLAYARTLASVNDTAEPHALLRNALTAQHDQNAILLLAGPATDLAALLSLPGTKDLIGQKVRLLVVAAGSDGLKTDLPATRKVLGEWPTPIVAAGSDLGDAIPFPGSAVAKDFTWAEAHPLVDAYRAYKSMPYDAASPALAAALHAIRPQEKYFRLSDPGVLTVLDDGAIRLAPSEKGAHRILSADPEQKERIVKAYVELVCARPVRQARPRPG